MGECVLTYAEAVQAGPRVVGGKGWNLARLHRYGFLVPSGGVVAAAVYREVIARRDMARLCAEVAGLQPEVVMAERAVGSLAALRAAIEASPLPPEAMGEIADFLASAGLAERPLAVRSSATAEDGDGASFAGMHRSFLNMRGADEVARAITACFASLWTPQAVAYRRTLGLADEEIACAVVLCAMVTAPERDEPVAAGVAFSCDPRTGARERVTIGAVRGLGEALASGSANPEEISVPMAADGAPREVRRGDRPEAVLTDEQAHTLASLVWRVHYALGDGQDPQDIEWAYDGERFWLLQARPVTRLPRVVAAPIAHLPTIWSNANLKDNMPGVASPLGWSYIAAAVGRVFGAEKPTPADPEGRELIRRFRGRPYMDMTSLQWSLYDNLGMMPQQVTQGLGGHQPQIPVPPGSPVKGEDGLRRMRNRVRLVPGVIGGALSAKSGMARLRNEATQLSGLRLDDLSSAELIAHGERIQRAFAECVRKFLFNAFGLWDMALEALIERYLPGRGRAVAAGLMSAAGGMVSAEHGYRLYDLAAVAARDPDARRYLESDPLDPWGWRALPAGSPFRAAFATYLAAYGHRGVYELDIANSRWSDDPAYLLGEVRRMLGDGRLRPPRVAARAVRRAAEAELRSLPIPVRPLARWLAAQARHGAATREAGKSIIAQVTSASRAVALEVGRRMVAQGVLADASDVFYLAQVDFMAYLQRAWDGHGAAAIATDRRAQREAWLLESPPDVFILDAEGRPASMPETPAPAPRRTKKTRQAPAVALPEGIEALAGTAATPGRGSGPARVIRHPSEGARLQTGDVLVAPSTDPAWSPLFLRASAIAMEVGGYHSHGAIVAREYGIPAVVNVAGLLERVRDGEPITVDGDAGQILLQDRRADEQTVASVHASVGERASSARA
jgi:rifampicin phosphotransferase